MGSDDISQGWFFYGPSISFKVKNLLVNFPSVFGLYDVLILVKVSFIDNSIYRGFLLEVVLWGFHFFFNCFFCNKCLSLVVHKVYCVLHCGTLVGWILCRIENCSQTARIQVHSVGLWCH